MNLLKKIFLVPAFALLATTQANAATFTSDFTGDNEVTGFSYFVDGVSTVVDFTDTGINLAGHDNWKVASSYDLTIADAASSYQFVWDTVNFAGNGDNPSAFLAQFSLNDTVYLTDNSVTWEVMSAKTGGDWTTVTLNTFGGTDALNGGSNIWSKNAGTISGISTESQWIWDGLSGAAGDEMSFRATVAVSAVPEPATLALMLGGLGLVGFMASRRKQA